MSAGLTVAPISGGIASHHCVSSGRTAAPPSPGGNFNENHQ